MLIKLTQPQDRLDNVSFLVHNDNSSCSQTTFKLSQSIEVHQYVVTEELWQQSDRGSSGNDGFEVVPATDDTTTVTVDQLSEGNRHFLFHCARVIDVSGNTEQFCASIVGSTEGGEPAGASSHDGWADCNCLNVGDGGWHVENSRVGWEWGF